MKSKNEILQQEAVKKYGETILKGQEGYSITYVAFNSDDGVLQNAMDEYAKEVALAFYEFEEGVPAEEMESNFEYFLSKQ